MSTSYFQPPCLRTLFSVPPVFRIFTNTMFPIMPLPNTRFTVSDAGLGALFPFWCPCVAWVSLCYCVAVHGLMWQKMQRIRQLKNPMRRMGFRKQMWTCKYHHDVASTPKIPLNRTQADTISPRRWCQYTIRPLTFIPVHSLQNVTGNILGRQTIA